MPVTSDGGGGAHSPRRPGVCPRLLLSRGECRVVNISEAARSYKVFEVDGFVVRGKVCGLLGGREKSSRDSADEAGRIVQGAFLVR